VQRAERDSQIQGRKAGTGAHRAALVTLLPQHGALVVL
jgi:hypothetical protein